MEQPRAKDTDEINPRRIQRNFPHVMLL